MQAHAISWFEIPTIDLDRATQFYEQVFQIKLAPIDTPNIQMRVFPVQDFMHGISGALVKTDGFHIPSESHGPLIYLNANPKIQSVIDRIEKAGGKVVMPKTQISPEIGYMAFFLDTEGNKIALHAQN